MRHILFQLDNFLLAWFTKVVLCANLLLIQTGTHLGWWCREALALITTRLLVCLLVCSIACGFNVAEDMCLVPTWFLCLRAELRNEFRVDGLRRKPFSRFAMRHVDSHWRHVCRVGLTFDMLMECPHRS
jgi:hypothetical protein